MVAQAAHAVSSVSKIERVATVGSREAQLSAFVDRGHVLENGIDRFQNTAVQFLELAQLHWVIDTVVLQVVNAGRRFESSRSGHRVPIHVGQTTISSDVIVVGRSARSSTLRFIISSVNGLFDIISEWGNFFLFTSMKPFVTLYAASNNGMPLNVHSDRGQQMLDIVICLKILFASQVTDTRKTRLFTEQKGQVCVPNNY